MGAKWSHSVVQGEQFHDLISEEIAFVRSFDPRRHQMWKDDHGRYHYPPEMKSTEGEEGTAASALVGVVTAEGHCLAYSYWTRRVPQRLLRKCLILFRELLSGRAAAKDLEKALKELHRTGTPVQVKAALAKPLQYLPNIDFSRRNRAMPANMGTLEEVRLIGEIGAWLVQPDVAISSYPVSQFAIQEQRIGPVLKCLSDRRTLEIEENGEIVFQGRLAAPSDIVRQPIICARMVW